MPGFINQNFLSPLLATRQFGFHFPFQIGFVIALSFAGFKKDTTLIDTPFEAAHRIVEVFAFAK